MGLLALLVPIHESDAQTYRYTGNMPAAKMTLDLMEVMGYIQRVPDSQYGGGSSSWPMASLMSPMSSLGGLPMGAGMMAMQNPWSGMSSWPGMAAGNTMPFTPQSAPGASAQQPGNGSIQVKPSDLAALLSAVQRSPMPAVPVKPPAAPQDYPLDTISPAEGQTAMPASSYSQPLPTRASENDVTVGALSGVWLGSNQDVLVVTGQRFIWTDKNAKTIEGGIAVQGNMLLTRLSPSGSVMTYRFQTDGDKFVAVNEAGHQYVFQRSEE
jgi:hypothetical protein